MHRPSQRVFVPGAAGAIECTIDDPPALPRGVAVICHPHPQHGGTMDNKVAQTLARAFVGVGWRAVRFNFRGVGASQGQWDHGHGEVDDALAVAGAQRDPSLQFALGGFSFGGYVAAAAAHRLREPGPPPDGLVLVAPATAGFDVPPAAAAHTLVIHGDADDVVPLQSTLAWARPQSLPVVVLPGVGHFFHGQLTLLKRLVMQGWRS